MKVVLWVVGAVLFFLLAWKMRRAQVTIVPAAPEHPEPEDSQVDEARIDELIASYSLRERETEFFGKWRETEIQRLRVAFRSGSDRLEVVVGNFHADEEQLTDVYLGQNSPSRPPARNQSLQDYVDADGEELVERYSLFAGISRNNPTLRIPGVRDALLGLSPSVVEVGTFEKLGVELWIDPEKATRDSVDADVRHAVSLVQALEAERLVAAP